MKTLCIGLLIMVCFPSGGAPPKPRIEAICQTMSIIVASRQDTGETLRAIRAHNAKIKALCK